MLQIEGHWHHLVPTPSLDSPAPDDPDVSGQASKHCIRLALLSFAAYHGELTPKLSVMATACLFDVRNASLNLRIEAAHES